LLECDVLVIGGGGAGMRAAIEAARLGCEVILADKGPVGRSGTTPMAMEAFQAVCLPEDSKELHFQDTVEGGRFLNDEKLVAVLVERAPEAVKDLERFGIRFKKKDDGRYDPMHHAGQTLPRTLFIQGGGYGLMMGLLKESRRHRNLTILQDVMAIKIWLEEGVPWGAIFLDLKDGELKAMKCKAVVLATGGYQELWSMNDAACTACGDGVFLAYGAGAELVDLEMMQFYPTVVIHPPSVKGTLFQYELVLDPEAFAGKLLNGRMQPFIEGQPVRDKIIQLLWKEVRAGRGSEHGGVYIDLVHSSKGRQELTEALEKWQPNQFHYLKDMGLDLRDSLIEVGPHAHFALGGIHIDESAATTVPGLFAAGEAAGNLHGANRLSGNALAETQVFGTLTGSSAAAFARKRRACPSGKFENEIEEVKEKIGQWHKPKKDSLRPFQVRQQLQELMWEKAGIERREEGLGQALGVVEGFKSDVLPRMKLNPEKIYPLELQEALEMEMMVSLSTLVLKSALHRRESRGHHFRQDFPGAKAREKVQHTAVRQGIPEPWGIPVPREEAYPWKG